MTRILAFLFIVFVGLGAYSREVEFSWAPMEGAVKYEIQVDNNQNFTKPIIMGQSDTPTFSTNLDFGEYFYRVRVLDKRGRQGKWSGSEAVIVSPYSPELQAPENGFETSYYEILPSIEYKWKQVAEKSQYEILITKSTGQKVLEKNLMTNEFKTDELPEGDYNWKVRTSISKTLFSNYSEPRKLKIIKKPMIPPTLIAPEKNGTSAAYRPVPFTWTKDPNAVFTDLYYEKLTGREAAKPFKKKIPNLTTTNYVAEYEEPGDYRWSVTAKEGKNTPGLSSAVNNFEVRDDILSAGNYELEFSLSPTGDLYTTSSARQTGGLTSISQQTSSSGVFVGFAGGYWLTQSFGVYVRTRTGNMGVENLNAYAQDTDLTLRARFGSKGFNQEFWAGYKIMDVIASENTPNQLTTDFTALGPMIGTRFNPTIRAGLKCSLNMYYFKPTANMEGISGLTADIFGASLGVSWNFMYQFWLGYRFKFDRINASFVSPGGNPALNSSWTMYRTEPFYLSLGFSH